MGSWLIKLFFVTFSCEDALEYATVEILPNPQSANRNPQVSFENSRYRLKHSYYFNALLTPFDLSNNGYACKRARRLM